MDKKIPNNMISTLIRSVTFLMIVLSILITYHVKVVQRDYEIFTGPEGPETEDYFEELGIIEP